MDAMERAEKGDVEFFRTISRDILLNARDKHDYSVLTWAAFNGHEDCVREICNKCPELAYHQSRVDNKTALIRAVSGGLSLVTCIVNAAIKFDLEKGCSIRTAGKTLLRMKSSYGHTALYYAVKESQFDVMKFLLEADPEFEESRESLLNMAMQSASSGNDKVTAGSTIREPRIATQFTRKGAKLDTRAASIGDLDKVKDIIQSSGREIDLVDDEKRNFVHLAAQFGRTKVIKFALEEADILSSILNAQDINGNTPLHVAALSGNLSTASCFLDDSRVLKGTLNNKGQPVLDVACEYGQEKAKSMNYVL